MKTAEKVCHEDSKGVIRATDVFDAHCGCGTTPGIASTGVLTNANCAPRQLRIQGMSCCAGGSNAAPPRPPLPHALLLLLLGAALLWPSAAAFPPALGDPTAGGGPLPFQAQGPFDTMPFAQPPPSPPLLAPAAALYPSQEDYDAVRSTLRLLEPELELEEAMGRALLLRDLQAQMQAQQLALAAAREAGPMSGREELLPPPPPPPQSQPEGLPAPLPLMALDAREEPPVKKMSYMSLCLFKICNMGRKRTNRS